MRANKDWGAERLVLTASREECDAELAPEGHMVNGITGASGPARNIEDVYEERKLKGSGGACWELKGEGA